MIKRDTIVSNFIWRLFDKFGSQLITVVVSIVLARILNPEDYGVLALVTVFTALLSVFIDSGLGSALVQKKNADNLDFSTVFYFNMTMSIILYGVMFFLAPYIARFYDSNNLVIIVRVVSLNMFISGFRNVQLSFVSRNLLFKKTLIATLVSLTCSATVAIIMACSGFGVWSLVFQTLTENFVAATILFFTVKWRPELKFSIIRLKTLLNFGYKILITRLVETGYSQLWQLVIGKVYNTRDLAFYNRGQGYPATVTSATIAAMDSILFPVMSLEQDDKERVRNMLRRGIITSTYIIMPIMAGLAACAYPLVIVMLTEKWAECVPFFMMFCFVYMFLPLYNTNQNATRSVGRSDLFLAMEGIVSLFGLIALLITVKIGIIAMAVSQMLLAVIKHIIYSWPSGKLLNYGCIKQFIDISPQLILSLIMGAIVYSIQFIGFSCVTTLVIQIPLGVIIYLIGSKVLKIDSYSYVVSIVCDLIQKNRKKTIGK